ncbi:MAG: type II toxin-antitoxin system RelE/ParE family toxin [Thermoguttaceae bacterium]
MSKYSVHFKPSADRQLKRLPLVVQRRIVAEVDALATNPRPPGVTKLVGATNLWRLRVGNYRIVYEIHDAQLMVLVLRVADRKDVYR